MWPVLSASKCKISRGDLSDVSRTRWKPHSEHVVVQALECPTGHMNLFNHTPPSAGTCPSEDMYDEENISISYERVQRLKTNTFGKFNSIPTVRVNGNRVGNASRQDSTRLPGGKWLHSQCHRALWWAARGSSRCRSAPQKTLIETTQTWIFSCKCIRRLTNWTHHNFESQRPSLQNHQKQRQHKQQHLDYYISIE